MSNRIFVPTVTHTRCAKAAAAVTPSDTTDLPDIAYFGLVARVAGNVNIDPVNGAGPVVVGIAAGIVLPIQVKRVYSTSTTATGIVALIQ